MRDIDDHSRPAPSNTGHFRATFLQPANIGVTNKPIRTRASKDDGMPVVVLVDHVYELIELFGYIYAKQAMLSTIDADHQRWPVILYNELCFVRHVAPVGLCWFWLKHRRFLASIPLPAWRLQANGLAALNNPDIASDLEAM